ncbi:hypothetical protein MTR62_10565 [Novosphingobium sp. 1949]|uniref:Pectate lyase superfamily protein domain-containing protein n=1 Tax=Novosphingobium organovorum TaxID=2930092 RepID=A0ABT0BDI6_9SPHN|nr:hypothetical protein [Novosphingobium organovorum]MCJ2183130.1 hypothetical protein [Novosphingobium organovorum]
MSMETVSRRSLLWALCSSTVLGSLGLLASRSIPIDAQDNPGVAGLKALKALRPGHNRTVALQAAGRSGRFTWDGSDLSHRVAADPLEGIYVAPAVDSTGASGAWVRQIDGPFDIRWFGASGSGDCLAAFNGALSAARSAGGGTIVFPEQGQGGWRLGGTAIIDADNVTIDLRDDVTLTRTTPCSTFRFGKDNGATLRAVKLLCSGRKATIDGNGHAMTGYAYNARKPIYPAVEFRNCDGVTVENVHVTNGLVNCLLVRFSSNIVLQDCDGSHSVYDNGISVNFALNYHAYDPQDSRTWTNARLIRCRGFDNNAVGITNYGGYGHTWTDCEAWGNGQDRTEGLPWGGGMTVEMNGHNLRDSRTTIINPKCHDNRNYDLLASTFGVTLIKPDFRGPKAPVVRQDRTSSYGSNLIVFGRGGVKVVAGTFANAGRDGIRLLATGPGNYPSLDFDGIISSPADYGIHGVGIAEVKVSNASQIIDAGKAGIQLKNINPRYNKGGGVAILNPGVIRNCGGLAIAIDSLGDVSSRGVDVVNCQRDRVSASSISVRNSLRSSIRR